MRPSFFLPGPAPRALVLLLGLVFFVLPAMAVTNVYSTRFEASEGYNASYELNGQNGWVSDTSSTGGNGLVTNFLGTQAAYLGLYSLEPPADSIAIWKPLGFSPIQRGLPIVRFSTLVDIVDSTTADRDDFCFSVYNSRGELLVTVDFYNVDLHIYYALGTNHFIDTGVTFTNDTAYTLSVLMDFAQNRWSATLENVVVVTNLALAPPGVTRDLGDIAGFWIPADPNYPGDNFMVFDNYTVTAEAAPDLRPRLVPLGRDASGQFLLRLYGPSGYRYAIDATANLSLWTPLRTNTVTDGSFDFIDTGARGLPKRLYRARLVN